MIYLKIAKLTRCPAIQYILGLSNEALCILVALTLFVFLKEQRNCSFRPLMKKRIFKLNNLKDTMQPQCSLAWLLPELPLRAALGGCRLQMIAQRRLCALPVNLPSGNGRSSALPPLSALRLLAAQQRALTPSQSQLLPPPLRRRRLHPLPLKALYSMTMPLLGLLDMYLKRKYSLGTIY